MFLLENSRFSIKKTPGKGRGVFAQQHIPAGTVIGDYLGRLVKTDDKPSVDGLLYDMYYNDYATIQPTPSAEGIHLINHSCVPNCYMYSYKMHTLYVATRKIWKGEELTVSYMCEPPSDASKATIMFPCNCGSNLCRGSMHANHIFTAQWEKRMHKKYGPSFDTIPIPYGQELPPLSRYPRYIKDSSHIDLYAHPKKYTHISSDSFPGVKTIRTTMRETGSQIIVDTLNLCIYSVVQGYMMVKELKK